MPSYSLDHPLVVADGWDDDEEDLELEDDDFDDDGSNNKIDDHQDNQHDDQEPSHPHQAHQFSSITTATATATATTSVLPWAPRRPPDAQIAEAALTDTAVIKAIALNDEDNGNGNGNRQKVESVLADELENTNHTPLDAWDFEEEDELLKDKEDVEDEDASNRSDDNNPNRFVKAFTTTDNNNDNNQLQQQEQGPALASLQHELSQYLTTQLPLLIPSINAILHAEYNTIDHAQHLTQYYQQRLPQLAKYTLEKELHRMQYQLRIHAAAAPAPAAPARPHDDATIVTLTDPTEIATYFDQIYKRHELQNQQQQQHQAQRSSMSSSNDMVLLLLLAASNQSLLADLLHVMTGPDRLIRPQYGTTCHATQCQFVMDVSTEPFASSHHHDQPRHQQCRVTCHAHFEISLPCQTPTAAVANNHNRLVVATFDADITFQPIHTMTTPPKIHYHVTKLDVLFHQLSNPEQNQALASVARWAQEMTTMMMNTDHDNNIHNDTSSRKDDDDGDESSNDLFRDMFFFSQEQTQQLAQEFIKSQQLGMSSAWTQVNAVVNLQSKFNTVTNLISSGQDAILRSAAVAATMTSMEYPNEYNEQQQQHDEEEEEEIAFPSPESQPHRPNSNLQESFPRPLQPLFHPPFQQSQQQQPQASAPPPPPGFGAVVATATVGPRGNASAPPLGHRLPNPAPSQHASNTTATDRPSSILGGFISRLAQSVAGNIPDEEDIYQKEYGFSTMMAVGNAGKASSVGADTGGIPQLYRRDDSTGDGRSTVKPSYQQQQLSRSHPQPPSLSLPAPPSLGAHSLVAAGSSAPFDHLKPRQDKDDVDGKPKPMSAVRAASADVVVQDGWDDDVDDILDDENYNNTDKNEPAFETIQNKTYPALAATTSSSSMLPIIATHASSVAAANDTKTTLSQPSPSPTSLAPAAAAANIHKKTTIPSSPPTPTPSFNPNEDNIIETRKRWINPRPRRSRHVAA